ncbi:MAG: hypothetical protein ABI397_01085 [Candidatus Saccharimonas sp.]
MNEEPNKSFGADDQDKQSKPDEFTGATTAAEGVELTGSAADSGSSAGSTIGSSVAFPPSSASSNPFGAGASTVTDSTDEKPTTSSSITLQWLTYALWGWFVVAMIWLVGTVLSYFFDKSDSIVSDLTATVTYPLTAVVVLLIGAGVVDFLYTKRENMNKTGVEAAVKAGHLVLYILCAVGLLLSLIFFFVQTAIDGESPVNTATFVSTIVIGLVLYAVLIARVVFIRKFKRLPLLATGFFAVVTVVFLIAGIAGPIANSISTKQDRTIEAALPSLSNMISDYTDKNQKLPASLSDLTVDGTTDKNVKTALDKNLIEYKANSKAADTLYGSMATYYYQLCVDYKDAGKSIPITASPADQKSTGQAADVYSPYPSTYGHGSGHQCYNVEVDSYGSGSSSGSNLFDDYLKSGSSDTQDYTYN